jgi:hypothetical protein
MDKVLLIYLCAIPLLVGAVLEVMFFSGKAVAQDGGIIVDGADYKSITTNEYAAELVNIIKEVTSRVVVEYGDFNSVLGFNKSDGLYQAASTVSARILVEYADFASTYGLQSSENLAQTATTVKPRIIVEYADFIFSTGLGPKPMEDNTPPATIISLDGVEGNNGWFTSDARVTLSATDDISGVDKTEYSFDSIAWTIYATPFNITTEGNTVIYYHSKDKAGNVETTKTQTIKIDKTAPSGSILINNGDAYTISTLATLTFTATDATSGVYQIRFSNDGTWDTESWETPTPTKTWTLMSGDGTKTVYYQIIDNSGLISTYSDTIILDTDSMPAEAFPMWIIGAVIAAIAIATVTIAVFWRKRKQQSIK